MGEIFDAPVDVILSPYNITQPDPVFVSRERSHLITEQNIAGAPNLWWKSSPLLLRRRTAC